MPSTWDASFSSVPLIRRCSFILEPHSSCIFFSCVSFFHVLCLCTLTPSIVYLPLKPFDVYDLPLHFEPILSSFQFDSPQCFCLFIESAFKFSIAFVISFSLIFVGFVWGRATHNTFFFSPYVLRSPSCFCLKLLELFEVYDCSFKICTLGLSKVILTREF